MSTLEKLRNFEGDLIRENERLRAVEVAARNLLSDVRRRYPGEALRCPFMIALDNAVSHFTARETKP